eukprot:CAMPEP_0194268470 /NCGR_PEP_ID=MMETSP0169-20130528/2785_1 /TAXON_ID=218684 /ORGANISM="Corethron pennatum, Strain L29A3" /LENGTH=663 /DNA_ID=CAMNT_0039009713 /DNA_START=182 /DNA_END=2173 /DNA_ORIENTATION=-
MYRATLILILAVPSTAATLRRTVAAAAWTSRSLQMTTEPLTPSERPSTAVLPKSSERPTVSGLTNSFRLPTTIANLPASSGQSSNATEMIKSSKRLTVSGLTNSSRLPTTTTEISTSSKRPSSSSELLAASERSSNATELRNSSEWPIVSGLTNSSRLPTTTEISTSSKRPSSSSKLPAASERPTGSIEEATGKPTLKLLNNQTKDPEAGRLPSYAPSHKPTNQLTITPTNERSNKPTDKPTNKPSNESTNKPTDKPTNKPTKQPIDKATSEPIDMPSGRPTATHEPSNKPTNEPTGKPMKEPTGTPSIRPTKFPSNLPTQKPTNELSNKPTYKPTRESTDMPRSSTNSPTFPPTVSLSSTREDDVFGNGGFQIDLSDENQGSASPTKSKSEIFPTESPIIQSDTSRCNDDKDFKHNFDGREVTCKWLRGAKPTKKTKNCDKTVTYDNVSQKVNKICPAACGQKCDNTVEPDGSTSTTISPTYAVVTTTEPTIQLDEPTEKPMNDITDKPTMGKTPEKDGSQKLNDSLIGSSLSEKESDEEEISKADFIGIILGAVGGVLAILSTVMMVIFYAYDRDEDKDAFRENMTRYCCFCFATSKAPPEKPASNRYAQPSGNDARRRMSNPISTIQRMSNPTPTMQRRPTPGVVLSFSSTEHSGAMSEI